MMGSGKCNALVTQYIRNLRGGSQPILAQASDGLHYVVKFTNNLQGPNLPFNESMGSELYRACGLAGPSWRPLIVTDAFLDRNRDCWMQTAVGMLRPDAGVCFGSHFLGGEGLQVLEILPESSFNRISNREHFWLARLVDACAEHCDNRQALFLEDAKGGLKPFFIDHGHLFRGAEGYINGPFRASRYLDSRIYPDLSPPCLLELKRVATSLDADKLWRSVERLPDNWKTQSAIESFSLCLHRLCNRQFLSDMLNALVNSTGRSSEFEQRRPALSVLRPGLQGAHRRTAYGV